MSSRRILNPGVHQPFPDDGATYCGWAGDGGIVEGCGEVWPCSTERARTERVAAPDCTVDRTPHGRPCEGPATYYCDEDLWGSGCRRWQARNGGYPAPDGVETAEPTDAERIARAFHEAYERLTPSYRYTTREASAKPWRQVPVRNRRLMIATVDDLLRGGSIVAPERPLLVTDKSVAVLLCTFRMCQWRSEDTRTMGVAEQDAVVRAHLLQRHAVQIEALTAVRGS